MGAIHLVLLCSALLLMKTAMLAVVVDSDNKPLMVQALWNAVKQTAASMQDFHTKAQTHSEQSCTRQQKLQKHNILHFCLWRL